MTTLACWFTADSVTICISNKTLKPCNKLGFWRVEFHPTKSDERWLSKKLERNLFKPEKARRIAKKAIHMTKCAEEGPVYDW